MTREQKERLVDQYVTGMTPRAEGAMLAAADVDHELHAMIEAERSVMRAVERDRAALMTAERGPGEHLLARLAATPAIDSARWDATTSLSGSRLSIRDIALVIGIVILLGWGTLSVYQISNPSEISVPETTSGTTPRTAPSAVPQPQRSEPTSERSTATLRSSAPQTVRSHTGQSASAMERKTSPDRDLGPATASDAADRSHREEKAGQTSTEPNQPPVFNDSEVRFEVQMKRDTRP